MAAMKGATAAPDLEYCVDVWPPCTLTTTKLAAYKALVSSKEIIVESVRLRKPTGVITVRYTANAPHEWILDKLRGLGREQMEQLKLFEDGRPPAG